MSFFRRKPSAPVGPPEFLIIGLGNPGKKYELSRHNSGFMFADLLAEKLNIKITKIQFKSLVGSAEIGGVRCLIIKPQTFMNNSGEAVREAAKFYKIPPSNILVAFDDVSLPCGKLRIRRKGSDGGHNGIKSIIYQLNSDEFPRIKIGVGEKPFAQMDLADWVLSAFTPDDLKQLGSACERACGAAELIVSGNVEKAMCDFNG